MKTIPPTFSHVNLQKKNKSKKDPMWVKLTLNKEIIKSPPLRVDSYDELVKNVAQILFRNRNFTLYYRGQSLDHKTAEDNTTILPSIYRTKNFQKRLMLKERFKVLDEKVEQLRRLFTESKIKFAGTTMLNKYPEISWALLQHYEVCKTPLLDLTHSLHVACSFAFDRNNNDSGIIQVLGLPWQTDAIGYNSFEEIVNVRLLSVCPPQAQRPYFQEGYLAGPFPNYQLDRSARAYQFDFARRLIAKFEIPINDKFWGRGFQRIPSEKLYQPNDLIKYICKKLIDKV